MAKYNTGYSLFVEVICTGTTFIILLSLESKVIIKVPLFPDKSSKLQIALFFSIFPFNVFAIGFSCELDKKLGNALEFMVNTPFI